MGLMRPLFFYRMPIFEWCMTRLVVKNVLHQVDMCYNEIGLCADQCIIFIVQGLRKILHDQEGICDSWNWLKRKE